MLPRVFFNSSLLFSSDQHSKETSCGAQPLSDTGHCVTAFRSHPRHEVVALVHRAGDRSGIESGTRMAFHQQLWQLLPDQSIHETTACICFQHINPSNIFFQIILAEVGLEKEYYFLLVCDTKTADSVRAAFAGKHNSDKCFRTTYFSDRFLQFFSLLYAKTNCLQQVTLLLHSPLTWTTGN